MMPGRASGSTSRNEMASRPKNLNLYNAYATAEPSSSASTVANSPTLTDRRNALRTWGSWNATEYQCNEKPAMGQLSMFDRLNEYSTMSTIGVNKNASTSTTQTRSAARSALDSMGQIASNAPSARAQSR